MFVVLFIMVPPLFSITVFMIRISLIGVANLALELLDQLGGTSNHSLVAKSLLARSCVGLVQRHGLPCVGSASQRRLSSVLAAPVAL